MYAAVLTETNRDRETEKTESSDLCHCVDRDRKIRFIPLCRQRQTETEKTERSYKCYCVDRDTRTEKTERSDLCYCVDRGRQRHRDREDRKIKSLNHHDTQKQVIMTTHIKDKK